VRAGSHAAQFAARTRTDLAFDPSRAPFPASGESPVVPAGSRQPPSASSPSTAPEAAGPLVFRASTGRSGVELRAGPYSLALDDAVELPAGSEICLSLAAPPAPGTSAGSVLDEKGLDDLFLHLLARSAVDAADFLPADRNVASAILARWRSLTDEENARDERPHTGAGATTSDEPRRPPVAQCVDGSWRGLASLFGEPRFLAGLTIWAKMPETRPSSEEESEEVVLNLNLSQLGPVTLRLRARPGHLHTTVTTREPLARALCLEIADLFGAAMELTGDVAWLVFKTGPEAGCAPAEVRNTRHVQA